MTESAIAELREMLPPGTTLRTILRHVASSGMTRWISPVLVKDSEARDISYSVAEATGRKLDRSNHEGIKVSGGGMDMGFSLVYSLSRTLYPDGFECTGEYGCPANDHTNDYSTAQRAFWITSGEKRIEVWSDGDDVTRQAVNDQHARMRAYIEDLLENGPLGYHKGRKHSDGGYALNHRWL